MYCETDENNNRILGHPPKLVESNIIFNGKNNILFCEENVKLTNSKLKFNGDNSIIYLSFTKFRYRLNITIYNNSVFFIDEGISMNGKLHVILSEEQNIIIGKDCLFSWGTRFRVADPHLIYDVADKNRINLSKGIFLGDHVWVGQESLILKGTLMGSGSILGAKSLVSNKKIPSNSVWGGNPVKKIREGVFFDKKASHSFTKQTAKKYMHNDTDIWIFTDDGEILDFKEIDDRLFEITDLDEKLEFIKSIKNNNNHNRFFIPIT